MIIHHVPMKSAPSSSFKKLVDYIKQKADEVRITNCHSIEQNWAVREIEATQAKNTRAKGDKTYHLIISFAPDEIPSKEVLNTIEDRVVASIGLSEHQRMSAVHNNTDNLHIHVAINKIHPKTLNMVEPYKAYKKFAEVAIALEKEFSLQETNHIPRHSRSENLAHDFERHTGIESLQSWIKEHCLSQLNDATNWAEFNQVLSEHHLAIKVRANGFVITSNNGVMVKASSISRHFSKSKLEAKFGQFNSSCPTPTTKTKEYRCQPMNKTLSSSQLYTLYLEETLQKREAFSEQVSVLRHTKSRAVDKAKSRAKLKRTAIKLTRASRLEKKVLYKLVGNKLRSEINKAHKQYKNDYNKLSVQYKHIAWSDWLPQQALAGNSEALDVMRRKNRQSNKLPALSGQKRQSSSIEVKKLETLTKEGTAIYKIDKSLVKDDGKEITISRGISIQGLKETIAMAKRQYGNCIAVNGSQQFKRVIARIAVYHDMQVTFDDQVTESFRKEFKNEMEKKNEQRKSKRDSNRGPIIRDHGSTRSSDRRKRGRGNSNDSVSRTKPHTDRARREPPTKDQNSLRTVSKLNVVQFARGSEVLLPNHAHDQLERQRTKSNNKVRRGIFGGLLGKKKNNRSVD